MKSLFDGEETLFKDKKITNAYVTFITKIEGKKIKFVNCTFQSCRWEQAALINIIFENCKFKGCFFDNSSFTDSDVRNAKFTNCYFKEFKWYGGTFEKVTFKDSQTQTVKFDDIMGNHASFRDSKIGVTFIGKDFNTFVMSNCEGGTGLRGTITNINISNFNGNAEGIGLGGNLKNIVIDTCKLNGLSIVNDAKITDLQVHNVTIGDFYAHNTTLNATNADKPNTFTNCPMKSLVIKDSKINDLTFTHCSINDYFVLKNTEFKNLKLKNMSYVENIDGTDLGGVEYDNSSDHFPPATEKK